MSVKVNLKTFQLSVKDFTEEVLKEVDIVLTEGAEKIEERAKNLAPKDRGLLSGSITTDGVFLEKRVHVSGNKVFYAAYQEFGTGLRWKDQGQPEVAKEFRGRANREGDFLKSIYEWLARKKYFPPEAKTDKQKLGYAKFVCYRIKKFGIHPANNGTGYFYRAYNEILPAILQDLERIK